MIETNEEEKVRKRRKKMREENSRRRKKRIHWALWIINSSLHSLTLHQTLICPPFKETWIFLIPSLIKITYIKECVRLHQGFHLFYNEVNAETQWLPLQCKWRPNDNLHYLNKVIAITLRYSNEDRCFEPSALNSLLLLQNIWKSWRRTDFGIIQDVASNSMWCETKGNEQSKVASCGGAGRTLLKRIVKVAWLTTLWKTSKVPAMSSIVKQTQYPAWWVFLWLLTWTTVCVSKRILLQENYKNPKLKQNLWFTDPWPLLHCCHSLTVALQLR